MHYFLGMEVWTREICSRYPEEVQDDRLQGHDHTYCIKHEAIDATMYRQMIGSLMYLTNTRPDVFFVVHLMFSYHEVPEGYSLLWAQV